MKALRQRMLDALQLCGKAERTQQTYIEAVARLAGHYKRSPDELTQQEVQAYLLHLLRHRQLARASVNQYGSAYRFFYGKGVRNAGQPLNAKAAQRWYYGACAAAGITKRGGIHTLRHCYATHLLEAGVDLHSLSQWLGHRWVSTTTRYLHLARPDLPEGARREPLALLGGLPDVTRPAVRIVRKR